MLNLWSTKTPKFFPPVDFRQASFPLVSFLYNYCFKHKFRTLQLMLLFNINVNTNSWHLLEIYHVDLVGFSPVFTLWDCCESCFFPFLFFSPKKLLSVCLLREMFAYLVPVHLDALSTQLCFGFGRFIVIIAV